MRDEIGDKLRFQHILEAIAKIYSFVDGISFEEFEKSDLIQSATERQLEITMEAFINLSDKFKSNHKNLDWEDIYGFRIILAHMYFKVAPKLLWDAIINDIPAFKSLVEDLIREVD